jgi:uncharacterized protein with GYD domain
LRPDIGITYNWLAAAVRRGRRVGMAKFLSQATYTSEGLKGLIKEGASARVEALKKLMASVGAKIESMYWAFGDTDLFLIWEAPDNATAAALSLVTNAAGAAKTKITVLLTAEEVDAARKKSVDYRPPGR